MSTKTTWFQEKIEALYKPTDQENATDFDKAFKQLFASNATIVANHKSLSIGDFEKQLQTQNGATNLVSSTNVSWKDLIEVPLKEGDDNGDGIVAGVFVVTRILKIRIRAAPAERLQDNVFSAEIVKDGKVEPDDKGRQWRVVQLFLTSLDKAAPVHIQSIPQI